MKQINLIQHDYKSHYAVYIFKNFIDQNYLKLLTEKTISLTEVDSMNRTTNVLANMTGYHELIQHEEYHALFEQIIEHLNFCIMLRTPHITKKGIDYTYQEAWGMQHFKNDFTKNHLHGNCDWSFAFYLRCPDDSTKMFFDDFNASYPLEENNLMIFPGLAKHRVNDHTSDISRVSIAGNIKTLYL